MRRGRNPNGAHVRLEKACRAVLGNIFGAADFTDGQRRGLVAERFSQIGISYPGMATDLRSDPNRKAPPEAIGANRAGLASSQFTVNRILAEKG